VTEHRRRPIRRASITNLGCKVNQAEMDALARLLRSRGVQLMDERAPVELHVVNTCTVTATADDKSRKAARRARRTSPDATVIVTGCSVAVNPAGFAADDPRALLADNAARDGLLAEFERLIGGAGSGGNPDRAGGAGSGGNPDRAGRAGSLDGPLPTLAGVETEGIADRRARIDRTRAFVKVQDGCSFHCTYCIIPRARGAERSLAPDAVLSDVRRALAAGHREIVLTGINVGTYDGGWSERGARGAHVRSALTLAGLVRRILAETDVERIRLSSIEPQHVDDDLLEAWTTDGAGRCLPHFHLPLQSGDDDVLHRMGRRYATAFYAAVVARTRAAIPSAAVHADMIVGFPTEDDAAWGRSLAFVRSMDLAGIHVFRYSERPGTPATRMAGRVPEPVRRARANELLALAASAHRRFAARAVGTERRVLFERPDPAGGWIGHAEDHVLVRAGARHESGSDLGVRAGELARVAIVGIDPVDPQRVVGRLLGLVPRPSARLPDGPIGGPVVRFGPGSGAPACLSPSSGGPA
jgi:threonylcarbamoyladenosine tRNA methylthiotransferase MtaB